MKRTGLIFNIPFTSFHCQYMHRYEIKNRNVWYCEESYSRGQFCDHYYVERIYITLIYFIFSNTFVIKKKIYVTFRYKCILIRVDHTLSLWMKQVGE